MTRCLLCRAQLQGAPRTEKHVRKQILILTGGVRLGRTQDRKAAVREETLMAQVAPDLMLPLSEETWLSPMKSLHVNLL